MNFAASEPGALKHGRQLVERVRVTGRRRGKHDKGKIRGRRADAVVIRDKLQRDDPSVWGQRSLDLFEKGFTRPRVEMMKKVGQENDVVPAAEVHVKGAPRDGAIAVAQGRRVRGFPGDRKDVGPIDGRHLGVRKPFRDFHAERSMTGRNIQDLADRSTR